MLCLQSFYGLSDNQTQYQIRDRYSDDWVFREALQEAGLMNELFAALDRRSGLRTTVRAKIRSWMPV